MRFGVLAIVALWLLIAYGYLSNIYSLAVHDDFASPYKAEVIRTVGIFVPPVGVVAGFITFDEEETVTQ